MTKLEEYQNAKRLADLLQGVYVINGQNDGIEITAAMRDYTYERSEFRKAIEETLKSLKDVIESRLKAQLTQKLDRLRAEAEQEAREFLTSEGCVAR